jgi:hypothetical protein
MHKSEEMCIFMSFWENLSDFSAINTVLDGLVELPLRGDFDPSNET